MNINNTCLLLIVFLAGCGPSATIETYTPSPTKEPVEHDERPVTIDFGGKSVYTQIHYEDIESGELLPGLLPGEYGISEITDHPNRVVDGMYSIHLRRGGSITTDPDVLALESNTTYLIDFAYKILDPGSDFRLIKLALYPSDANPNDTSQRISSLSMVYTAEEEGTYALGAHTGDAPGYILQLYVSNSGSFLIDNIRVLRQDPRWNDRQPEYWGNLEALPFPRLGNYALMAIEGMAVNGFGEPFYYSPNLIESRLSMFDVIAGSEIVTQTMEPGLTFRLRSMNPDILIMPYTIAHEHGIRGPEFSDGTIDLYYSFQSSLADEWIVRDSQGNIVPDPDYPNIYKMNVSEFCPVVEGQTFQDALIDWVVNTVLKSGNWDGIFIDNLLARVNPHILNRWDPALFDYDYNQNGQRDETLAVSSDMTRRAAEVLLERLRNEVGDSEIIIGNVWAFPETEMAPYVNGFIFECVDDGWETYTPRLSEPSWRLILDQYFYLQAETVSPPVNILEGCGNHSEMEPREGDLRSHRLSMGTALLSDGFYEYDLYDNRSAPYWFDEYTVNADGVAEEAPENKGYLGLALGEAVELKSPAETLWEADFEAITSLNEIPLRAGSGVSLSRAPEDVIAGVSSLVLDNHEHGRWSRVSFTTLPTRLAFSPGQTYVVAFDWRVIETLDIIADAYIWNGIDEEPHYKIPGVVAGDGGTAIFPITLGAGSGYYLEFDLSGGGKIAIDNIHIRRGGAGPWRRDFENGFVLVNPLNKPYTFTLNDLSGNFGRTGIKRILGTQAPEVNNGQPVIDSLTLPPFDAIILLADSISLE